MSAFMDSAIRSAEEMRVHLTQKAMDDLEFRSQLVADPKATINKEFGIDLPGNVNIEVHESDMRTIHLALPPGSNLAEEQLDAVSAGLCCCL